MAADGNSAPIIYRGRVIRVMSRDLFARVALAEIPKILTLQDRNRQSPTYGCFDRNFWQYKIIDFPSGMAQEFVYPLALAWDTDLDGNPFYRSEAVREWVRAGIAYAASSGHVDGSCDDYFPFERAAGAAAFSLLACIESYRLLDLSDDLPVDFFRRRGRWLARHMESGRLSNHEALIALIMCRLHQMTGEELWQEAFESRLARLLSWQHQREGWFWEYDGCDPGYLTLTIGALASVQDAAPRGDVEAALGRAIDVAAQFVHPDGSFGGEYGSRNTYNFFPHGFELAGEIHNSAVAVNDCILRGIEAGLMPCYADDHIVGHHLWSYLLAWRHFRADRRGSLSHTEGIVRLPDAGLEIHRHDRSQLIVAARKGGVFKLFREDRLIASDTQISLRLADGRVAVAHLQGKYDFRSSAPDASSAGDHEIVIEGHLAWAKQAAMTPAKLIVLRLAMLTFGRFFPNMIRRILQRLLITGRTIAPFTFRRHLIRRGSTWTVRDEVWADDWSQIERAMVGVDQTSIHVVMSRTYQAGQLQNWTDLTDRISALEAGQPLVVERTF